jgi:replicative DNA helicase Mcm
VPQIGELLKEARKKLKLSAKNFYGYKNYSYERNKRYPTRNFLQSILNEFGIENLEKLEKFANSDIFWDRVKKVKIFENKEHEYVYDVSVEDAHSFVGNGIVIHNTAAVTRDEEFLGGWVLEGGAIVMSNKSVCCIDEFNKVSPSDRVALQEAMSLESYHPNTEITLLDGTSLTISEFVEGLLEKYKDKVKVGVDCLWLEVPEKIKILTTDFHRIYPTFITRVSKHKAPEYFYKIKIATGREILVTPNHPCFVLDGEVKCVSADKIKPGDYFPVPSIIPLEGSPQKFEIKEEEIRSRSSAKHIRLPMHNSPDFCKFLGYLVTEGCGYTTNGREYGICFTNSKEELLEDFRLTTKKLFGLDPSKISKKGGAVNIYYNSVELFNFLKKIEPKILQRSWKKELPKWVKKLPKEEIKSLLRAAFDGDGCAGNGYVYFTTTSKKLALQVQELLNILGVLGYLRKRLTKVNRVCWDVVIKGSENLRKFVNEVGFSSEEKNRKIISYVERASYRKNLSNTIPNIQDKVRLIMKGLKAYQKEISGEILTKHFKHQNNFTILVLRRIVKNLLKRVERLENLREKILKACSKNELKTLRKKARVSTFEISKEMGVCHQAISYLENKSKNFPLEKYRTALLKCVERMLEYKKEVEKLEKLAFSQIRWIPITSVEKIKNNNIAWVYDVTTENERFISNCMVLHNTISIAKASIVATLPAQTAILAGANPKLGRFDPYLPIREQVDIDDVLLSRFDLKFALRDVPNPELDAKMAEHILKVRHLKTEEAKPIIPPEFLRKYIAYARAKVHPVLTKEAGELLMNFYLEMRKKSGEEAPIAITLRQYEALIRLAEASAKVQLRNFVTKEDAERAIRLMKISLREFGFEPETGMFDIDRAEGQRVTAAQRSKIRVMIDILEELTTIHGKNIPQEEFLKRAKEEGVEDAEEIMRKMISEGIIFQPKPGFIQKV